MKTPNDTAPDSTAQTEIETAPPGGGLVPNKVSVSWNVRLSTLRANLAHNDDKNAELFVWCFLHCTSERAPMTRHEFASRIGFNHSYVYKIMNGTNKDAKGTPIKMSAKFLEALQAFKKTEVQTARGAPSAKVIKTPTLQRIQFGCDIARESESPVFLTGPSQVGKTVALKHYTLNNNHGRTVYVRLAAAAGLNGMLRAIAKGIGGIGLKANNATILEGIKTVLRPGMLLILDEFHELLHTYRKQSAFKCIEVIREIYDNAGCGMLICSTNLLLTFMEDNRGQLEQFLRRGVHRIPLPPAPTVGDVRAVVGDIGLTFPKKSDVVTVTHQGASISDQPYEFLREVSRKEGLKAITERLRYGLKIARKAETPITWEHVTKAHVIIATAAIQPGDDWS